MEFRLFLDKLITEFLFFTSYTYIWTITNKVRNRFNIQDIFLILSRVKKRKFQIFIIVLIRIKILMINESGMKLKREKNKIYDRTLYII